MLPTKTTLGFEPFLLNCLTLFLPSVLHLPSPLSPSPARRVKSSALPSLSFPYSPLITDSTTFAVSVHAFPRLESSLAWKKKHRRERMENGVYQGPRTTSWARSAKSAATVLQKFPRLARAHPRVKHIRSAVEEVCVVVIVVDQLCSSLCLAALNMPTKTCMPSKSSAGKYKLQKRKPYNAAEQASFPPSRFRNKISIKTGKKNREEEKKKRTRNGRKQCKQGCRRHSENEGLWY